MRTHSTSLLGVLLVVVILAIVVPIAVVIGRRRAKTLIAAYADRPFAFGQPMGPVPGSFRDFGVDIVGLPGVVSVMPFVSKLFTTTIDPSRLLAQRWMAEPNGRVHVKVPLGPAWPALTIQHRAGAQQLGALLTRGDDGVIVQPTGDPGWDADYELRTRTPDPRLLLAIVNPQVRQFMAGGTVLRWLIGGGMWIETGYQNAHDEAAAVDWTIRLAALIVTSAGLPVIRPGEPGPPPSGPYGQLPA